MAHHPAKLRAMDQDTPSTPAGTVDERDAASYVGFTDSYLRSARAKGRGPAFIRIGRAIRYRIKDLDTWLAKHRVDTRDSR